MTKRPPPQLRVVEGGVGSGASELRLPAAEPDSFSAAFRTHYRLVHRMVREYGVPEALADDAAQEVFLIVHRRWEDYDGRAAFRKWLLGICRRVASNHRRTSRRSRVRLERFVPWQTHGDLERSAEDREAVIVVERFLASLDDARREVFVLSDIEGLTAPEISEMLGVKLNTVYSRLRSARERFEAFVARHHARERGRGHARAK